MYYRTNALDIIDMPADKTHCGGTRIFPPRFIYIHATGGTDSRAWLTHTSVPPVSCHRLISKNGTIYKIVPDNVKAYTQGYGTMGHHKPLGELTCNTDGLSVELENLDNGKDPYPRVQVRSLALQIDEWWSMYGYLPLLAHSDVDVNKKDPQGFTWNILYEELRALCRNP